MMIGGLRIRSLIFFLFLLVRSSSQVAPDPTANIPSLPDMCGDVTVPFPFGLTDASSYQKSPGFQLSCNKRASSGDPPRLMWGTLPVVDINVQQGEMTLSLFISYSCYRWHPSDPTGSIQLPNETYANWYSIPKDWSFTISPKNKLTTIGCDTMGFLTGSWGKNNFTGGCASYCQSLSNSTSCDGVGCCQTAVPQGTRRVNFSVSSFQNYTNLLSPAKDLECGYAFLVREDNFTFDPSYLVGNVFLKRSPSTRVLVEWAISGQNDPCEDMTNICGANSECVNFTAATGYQCKCKDGFRGNPYLPNGCEDIDECKEWHPNPCGSDPSYAFCKNGKGNYTCVCASDGKTPININGRNEGDKCPAESIPLYQRIIAACVSVAFVLLGVGRLCYRYKMAFANKTTNFSRNGGLKLQEKIKSLDKDGSNTGDDLIRFKERKLKKSIDKGNIVSDPKDGADHMGKVYKGRLRNEDVVIKEVHLGEKEQKDVDVFVDSVVDLYKTRNHNILQLLGYCFETKEPLLVYKFSPIRWRATHNDVYSLLEIAEKTADWFVNFPPHVIAVRLTTIVQETMDFPLTENFKMTSDASCFGVVMAALFTGEKPWRQLESSKTTVDDDLTTHCISLLNKAFHDQKPREGDAGSLIVDSTDRVQELIVELVKRCFREDIRTMEQVLGELRNIKGNCC